MNADTHIYLYAKGHYQTNDILEDLRQIVAHRSNLSPTDVSNRLIVLVVAEVAYSHIKGEQAFVELVSKLADCRNVREFLKVLLVPILLCKTAGLNLGKSDSSVLPLNK